MEKESGDVHHVKPHSQVQNYLPNTLAFVVELQIQNLLVNNIALLLILAELNAKEKDQKVVITLVGLTVTLDLVLLVGFWWKESVVVEKRKSC